MVSIQELKSEDGNAPITALKKKKKITAEHHGLQEARSKKRKSANHVSLSSAEASFIFGKHLSGEGEWGEVKRKRAQTGEEQIQSVREMLAKREAPIPLPFPSYRALLNFSFCLPPMPTPRFLAVY